MPRKSKTTPPDRLPPPDRAVDENDWAVYIMTGRGDRRFREQLVRSYMPVLEWAARKVARNVPTGWIEIDDLMSVGAMAMLDAADRYDPETGNTFWTFAYPRVWGAMMDCKETFREVTRSLPMPQQTILYLYYWCGASMKRIAEVMGFSESRVSQLHSTALTAIRQDLARRKLHREDVT